MSQYEKSRREAKSLFVHITSHGDINIYLEMKEFLKKKNDQIFFGIENQIIILQVTQCNFQLLSNYIKLLTSNSQKCYEIHFRSPYEKNECTFFFKGVQLVISR